MMKRIFVAVDISNDARKRVADHISALRNEFPRLRVGWERPEKLHLTLKFLGDTDHAQLAGLKNAVEDISSNTGGFRLKISDPGIFPNRRNPRVLWLDVVDRSGSLKKINDALEAECEKLGFEREKRAFVPHLTIGRVREPARAQGLAQAHLQKKFEPVEFEVSEIVIYESKLLPTGSVYSAVSKHRLEQIIS